MEQRVLSRAKQSMPSFAAWARLGLFVALAALPGGAASPIFAHQAAAPSSSAGIISRERIREIRRRAMLRPESIEWDPTAARFFGFTTPFRVKQASFGTRVPRRSHFFSVPMDGDNRSLLLEVEGNSYQIWVCDLDGNLLAAAIVTEGILQSRTIDVARPLFDEEMRLWATNDDFSPRDVPPPRGQ